MAELKAILDRSILKAVLLLKCQKDEWLRTFIMAKVSEEHGTKI